MGEEEEMILVITILINEDDYQFLRLKRCHSKTESANNLDHHDNNFCESLINFLVSYIAIGIFSFPHKIHESGVVLGCVCHCLCAILAFYGSFCIIESRRWLIKFNFGKEKYQEIMSQDVEEEKLLKNEGLIRSIEVSSSNILEDQYNLLVNTEKLMFKNTAISSYLDLTHAAFGRLGQNISIIFLFENQMLGITEYLYFVNQYFPSWIGLLIITPICMGFQMRYISYISLISLILILSSGVFFLTNCVEEIENNEEKKGEIQYFKMNGFPLIFGITMFLYGGGTTAINIEDSMSRPKDFYKVASISMLSILSFDIFLTVIPYFAYIGSTDSLAISSLHNPNLRNYLKIAYPVSILCSIPIVVYPLCDILSSSSSLNFINFIEQNTQYKRYFGTICILVICQICCLAIPNINIFLNICGVVCGTVGVVIPILVYNKVLADNMGKIRWFIHLILISLVVNLGIVSILWSIKEEVRI